MKVRLAYVLDKTRYFALLSSKWQYLILKRQETGTKHVATATSKCVPPGIFRKVQHPCKFQYHSFIIGRDILNFVSHHCTCTTGDVISDQNLHNRKTRISLEQIKISQKEKRPFYSNLKSLLNECILK